VCAVEVLTPDFKNKPGALDRVLEATPAVFAHNVETVPRLYRTARRGSSYEGSVSLLAAAAARRDAALHAMRVKSSVMLGLGERDDEVLAVMADLRRARVDVLTLGQDLNAFGHMLHEAWQVKKSLEGSITNPTIDQYYERALRAGALGGKLLGAGGGGFFLFFCEPHKQDRVRAALSGLTEVPFKLEPQGAKLIYVGEDHWQCDAAFSWIETA
jgi:galactokinase/mevalonate kinase-like predicted kinase